MKVDKAIILAGGYGTRLKPFTNYISKHLLPLYNKPIIYYPLANIMSAGIRNILLISNPEHIISYKNLFGDGSKYGITIRYKKQLEPKGIPEAFIIGRDFIKKSPVCLNLGDHILYGKNLDTILFNTAQNFNTSTIFSAKTSFVNDSGVPILNNQGKLIKIIEKPKKIKSKKIICGIYFYDNDVINKSIKLKPSKRKEIEITDLNNSYISENKLKIVNFAPNIYWHDAGDLNKIYEASKKIKQYETKIGHVASIEKIALDKKFINKREYLMLAEKNSYLYSKYLKSLL